MRTPIIAGNWKMNTNLDQAVELAASVRDQVGSASDVECVLAPPFPWIVPVGGVVRGSQIKVGAQNCYSEPSGAYTGEVSPEMLADHCSHVILGHSERRHLLGESDEAIRDKIATALTTSLSVILCVGETLEEREADLAERTVKRQLESAIGSVEMTDPGRLVIAYEPVWAIGTGKAASADDAQEMSAFVRRTVAGILGADFAERFRIQYGGSVKGSNAAELMSKPDVDGALVGGASLDPTEFAAIVQAASSQAN